MKETSFSVADDVIFNKNLGWSEYNEDGDHVPASIIVVDANIGYCLFRVGVDFEFIEWCVDREITIENCIDIARREIARHEIEQSKRD